MEKRIIDMESRFDKVSEIIAGLNKALEEYDEISPEIDILDDYYKNEWIKDYEADERGEISNIKKGILSQDALYDLLCEIDSLRERIK